MTSKDQKSSIMNCLAGISRNGQVLCPATVEGMGYWLLSTVDDKGNNALGGGMMKRQSPQQQGITNYFDVKSVQEYSAKVEQLGGKVISSKMLVPGMGYIAICTDTENNGFGIFEADQTAK
jgi:uncharacterized protein